jgi:hypothetical protein
MGRSVDDLLLVICVQIDKIIAVTGNPNQKVPVLVRL